MSAYTSNVTVSISSKDFLSYECVDWLIGHVADNDWSAISNYVNIGVVTEYTFCNSEDATAFKLRFGGA